ncbi:MAG: SGNH/GDSL hydrolase family protein, partial [Lentisphaeria bacterium]|nr:SGNH/GDSL hydrolase family protein [Lentisphaeria bacterium]
MTTAATVYRNGALAALLCAGLPACRAQGFPLPGGVSSWHGFERHDFELEGRQAILVRPRQAAPGKPWIWRARFWGHEPQTDLALLEEGFHVAYMDVAGLYGAPRALELWDRFHAFATQTLGLHPKPALECMSRGGLIAYRWASRNPERVACIYADAPVCDFRSWPRGKSPGDWQACLDAYGLSAAEALEYAGNPIDALAPLAECGVPLLHVCGADDTVVPVADNTAVLEQRYRELGGTIDVILKPGIGHHPHSLPDPTPIVRFVLRHTREAGRHRAYRLRGNLAGCGARFRQEGRGRIVFLGGSITQMEGYRPRVMRMLEERFPRTRFDFVNA